MVENEAANLVSCPTESGLRCNFSTGKYSYIRNRYFIDHADVVLAVYDMQANKRSGTGNTIHYAQAGNKPIM